MIKIWVLIMVLSDGTLTTTRPVTIIQEFNSLETCEQAMNSITHQVRTVHSSGCYEK